MVRRGQPSYSNVGTCTNSETAFERIHEWLRTCFEKHSVCRRYPASSQTPTRLVHIDWPNRKIRLLESVGSNPQYVTLSYRWGASRSVYKLTAETKVKLTSESGESIDRLPRTIHDACFACHRLGYSHLWVDRLCILQDCKQDWVRESSKMSQVYRNSVCTISASCAADEDRGLFTDRSHFNFQPFHIRIKPSQTGSQESLVVIPDNQHEDHPSGMLGYLANRGWVFQERLLSKRTVYFGKEQVFWECSELQANESWPCGQSRPPGEAYELELGTPYHQHYVPPRMAFRSEAAWKVSTVCSSIRGIQRLLLCLLHRRGREHGAKKTRNTPARVARNQDPWPRIVADYTARVFTFADDKLPGLSGLATDFNNNHRNNQDEYYAGLWKSTIIQDLCWQVTRQGSKNSLTRQTKLPSKYRAPSWSWASLDSKIQYEHGVQRKPVFLVDFKDICLAYASSDRHGAICDGWIKFSGFLKPVIVSLYVDKRKALLYGPKRENLDLFYNAYATFDVEDPADETQMFCLPMIIPDKDNKVYFLFLLPKGTTKHPQPTQKVLELAKEGPEEFQRVGLGSGLIKDETAFAEWLSRSPKQDIVIR